MKNNGDRKGLLVNRRPASNALICDRCGGKIQGGYFPRSGGSYYHKEGENILCDRCMLSDDNFLRDSRA